jgi:hypothetical protein
MEQEVFFLLEMQGGTYSSVMEIPYSRRKRYVEQKSQLEASRRSQEEQTISRARMRARSRRRR